MKRSVLFFLAPLLATLLVERNVSAFPHVVREGETLARIAERYYGKAKYERVLVTENRLDELSPRALRPGFLLEIPTVRYHRVAAGDSWETLSLAYLGDTRRSVRLAEVNGSQPWVPPELGRVLTIPHQLAYVLRGEESITTLSYRFLGSTKEAYPLSVYNGLEKERLERGQLLFIPLADLALTPEGTAARHAYTDSLGPPGSEDPRVETERSAHRALDVQRDVRQGRYVQAVSSGERLLASPTLPDPARVKVLRALLTAYTALDAKALGQERCSELRRIAPDTKLSEITTSPKERTLCPEPALPPPAAEKAP